MGCNQCKAAQVKKKKKEEERKKERAEAADNAEVNASHPSAQAAGTSPRQTDAHTSQAAQVTDGEHPQANADSKSEETTYDHLQSESERTKGSQERQSDNANPPAEGDNAPAPADTELKEMEVAAGTAAPAGEAGVHTPATDRAASMADAHSAGKGETAAGAEEEKSTTPAEKSGASSTRAAAADNAQSTTVAPAALQEDTVTQSEIDFEAVTEEHEAPPTSHDDVPTFHEEPQPSSAKEEEEVHIKTLDSQSTPNFQSDKEEEEVGAAVPAPLPPTTSDAEAVTPMAQDRAPEPTPQQPAYTDHSSASHSRTSAPFLHTTARSEQRRLSQPSFTAPKPNSRPATAAERRDLRKTSNGNSLPTKKKKSLQERPPWADVITPPVEPLEEEKERNGVVANAENHDLCTGVSPALPSSNAPAPHRHVEQIDAEGCTPSVQRSDRLTSGQVSRDQSAPRLAARQTPPQEYQKLQQYTQQQQYSIERLDRSPAAPSFEPSEQESAIPAAAMPMNTPKERVAARRRRSSATSTPASASAELVHRPPPPSAHLSNEAVTAVAPGLRTPRITQPPPRSIPLQHVQHVRTAAAAPPIPFRTAYTDPSPAAEASGQHRAPTTQMPPPTAYYMDDATRGPRRLSFDPAVMAAIETSTAALVRAHTPVASGSARYKDPSIMSQRSLPLSTMDAAVYREPGKLPPSHLVDPVYGPASAYASSQEGRSPYGEQLAPPSNGGAASVSAAGGRSKAGSSVPGSTAQSVSGSAKQSQAKGLAAPSSAASAGAAAPRQVGRSTASSRSGVPGAAAPYASVKAPPGSGDFGVNRYGDEIDAVSESASSYLNVLYPQSYDARSSNSRTRYEPHYSNPQEPREPSAQSYEPYEPSLTDEMPTNMAVLRPDVGRNINAVKTAVGAVVSSSDDAPSNRAAGAAATASQPSKLSSAVHSKASWSPADGPSLNDNDAGNNAEYDEIDEQQQQHHSGYEDGAAAYQSNSYVEAQNVEGEEKEEGKEENEGKEEEYANDDHDAEDAAGAYEEEEASDAAQPQHGANTVETTTTRTVATTTVTVATAPSVEGQVTERQEPEWQLLQPPPPEENKSLYQQAKFVAQMRNVTTI